MFPIWTFINVFVYNLEMFLNKLNNTNKKYFVIQVVYVLNHQVVALCQEPQMWEDRAPSVCDRRLLQITPPSGGPASYYVYWNVK